jgi:choline kinase
VRPDDQKSPLLQPANEHKQLVVIDFEYAAANLPGLEFANHFTEWAYNYHDPVRPYACDTTRYPAPDQQRRFVKAYVDHRPQFPYVDSPATSPRGPGMAAPSPSVGGGSGSGSVSLHAVPSSSSIVEFMLDARVPAGGWKEEERKGEEAVSGRVEALLEETRLWRTANSAQWVAWGIVQAKVPGLESAGEVEDGGEGVGVGVNGDENGNGNGAAAVVGANGETESEDDAEEEFDYLAYAQERALFFLGDCVLLGLVKAEELGEEVRSRIKLVEY